MSYFPLVVIVVLNWNGLEDSLECLRSLSGITYPNISIVCVDNGSGHNEADAIQSHFPDVRIIRLSRNTGFAGGNNIGIEFALNLGADFILCLNNDTVVDPEFLEPLVQALQTDEKTGIVSSAIYYYDRPEHLNGLGCWIDLSRANPVGHNMQGTDIQHGGRMAREVSAVDGCVLMMKRQTAIETGGFDNAYFAYLEDADLCLRARGKGWHCLASPESRVWHKIGRTTGGEYSPAASHLYTRNSYRFVARHGTKQERSLFRYRVSEHGSAVWESYFRDVVSNPCVRHDAERRRMLVVTSINHWAGRCGMSGSPQRYRALAKVGGLIVSMFAGLSGALLPKYDALASRLYWKTHAVSPGLAQLCPKPLAVHLVRREGKRQKRLIALTADVERSRQYPQEILL